MNPSLAALIDRFAGRRVLVAGDAILDHYIIGGVSRTSPEAPVPVLRMERQEWLPGGAANVARNLAAAGASVEFLSLAGEDAEGTRLAEVLAASPGLTPTLIRDTTRPTTLKSRYVAQGQQMLRVDRESTAPLGEALAKQAEGAVRQALRRAEGVILSDYGKGFLTPAVLSMLISGAAARGIEVIVDPKGTDYRRYRGATLITPNKKEAQDATGVTITGDAELAEAARRLQREVAGQAVCITLGPGGVAVFPRRGKTLHIPARAREVYDVTGAGDTFIALMGLARFSGASWAEAAELGNAAAGIVVGRAGVATCSAEELRRELGGASASRKWIGEAELVEVRRSLGRGGRRLVFTNGCFDLLSVRHIRLLEEARALGDVLAVGLNSDESVRRLKGAPRPLLTLAERAELLAALPFVDYVTAFEGDSPEALLRRLAPDVLVKGSNTGHIVGREIVEAAGGEIRVIEAGEGPAGNDIVGRALAAAPGRTRKRRAGSSS